MTIYGWDASNWDYDRGPVDVAAAVRDGISFMTAKATEGISFTDGRYGQTAAKARGVVPLFGAYHVLHPASISPIAAQVDHFLAVLDQASPWWRGGPFLVQLDCERWTANDFPQRADIDAWCGLFMRATEALWTPIVYASHGQYGDSLTGLNRPLWNANYGSNPAGHYREAYPGDSWPGWAPYSGRVPVLGQYGSQLTFGSQPGCDANAFRGSLSELLDLVGGQVALTDEKLPAGAPNAAQALSDLWNDMVKGRSGFANADGTHDVHHVNQQLNDIQKAIAALSAAPPGFTDAQVQAIADRLVASNANGLTAADHAGVVEDVKAALRTGTGS